MGLDAAAAQIIFVQLCGVALDFMGRSDYNGGKKVQIGRIVRKGGVTVTISAAGRAMYQWDHFKRPETWRADQTAAQAASQRGGSPLHGGGAVGRMPPIQEKDKAEGRGLPPDQLGREPCQTCENRKYQDGSDDPGVSYKTPTAIDPDTAASAVRGHEMEHVTRERNKARLEGREVVSQSVVLHTAICPECGKSYVSGGETRTVTRAQQEQNRLASLFRVGVEDEGSAVGRNFSAIA